jgi:hypothetical protein
MIGYEDFQKDYHQADKGTKQPQGQRIDDALTIDQE